MVCKTDFLNSFESILKINFGKNIDSANIKEKYFAASKVILEEIVDDWIISDNKRKYVKNAYYFSAEFLMGRAFSNNLINLMEYGKVKDILYDIGININDIEEMETDAGLGNGGLGRLAACFLDSCATLSLPVTGYGILYENGIFEQKFVDGFQFEEVNHWLKDENPWIIKKSSEEISIDFSDFTVRAVPYDMPVVGYGNENINTLRLWKSKALSDFDFDLFNNQNYEGALSKRDRAEDISRVLYPNDSTDAGKILRLRQEYFFSSASIQDIVRKYKNSHGNDFRKFSEYVNIQLNDTHPVVAIGELIRIFMDEENIQFDEAFEISKNVFAYTNHTILSEALEKWDINLFKSILPRVYEIIEIINRKFENEMIEKGIESEILESMKIINDGRINMAFLAIYVTHSTNGVAKLHTDILKHHELKNWHSIFPERFNNKTNGITQRRWLLLSNPELSNFISDILGDDSWITDFEKISAIKNFVDDENILKRFIEIKKIKKNQLKDYIMKKESIDIRTDSIFDIQIKRLHEYKRQLLNAFHIVDLYNRIKENPDIEIIPRTFIFGAKAAPGYRRAKGIIKYINEIASLVNNDEDIKGKIKVVFVENYNVTYGEKLFAAADISEQISTAGKEASGTGNMKFMVNGTPTIGTYDGANVEIVENAGFENNFIFGARVEELTEIRESYDPSYYYNNVEGLKDAIDTLIDGTFSDGGSGVFRELYDSIITGEKWHRTDEYFLLKDFEDYRNAQMNVDMAYRNQLEWAKKCLLNLSSSWLFSSDRTIKEYANEIWRIEPCI